MKLVLFIWMGWLWLAAPVHADSPPQLQAPLVADEGLEGHRAYLDGRMALGWARQRIVAGGGRRWAVQG